jgi:hypothetical protein
VGFTDCAPPQNFSIQESDFRIAEMTLQVIEFSGKTF